MKIYEKTIQVKSEDLDDLNHVNNVRYVQWIQNIAKEHWLSLTSEDLKAKYYWVVVSHFIEYKASAVLGDLIKLKTYVEKSEGVKSIRIVEMSHSDSEKLMVRAETVWCFMDGFTKRPTRVTQDIIEMFN